MQSITRELNSHLSDDDKADGLLFKEALEVLALKLNRTGVKDGQQLLERLLPEGNMLSNVLFLGFNMPRKNRFATLYQIKRNEKLIKLPVIVVSTANDQTKGKMVFRNTAHCYMR
jgi:CheY-like chemotaxis protein